MYTSVSLSTLRRSSLILDIFQFGVSFALIIAFARMGDMEKAKGVINDLDYTSPPTRCPYTTKFQNIVDLNLYLYPLQSLSQSLCLTPLFQPLAISPSSCFSLLLTPSTIALPVFMERFWKLIHVPEEEFLQTALALRDDMYSGKGTPEGANIPSFSSLVAVSCLQRTLQPRRCLSISLRGAVALCHPLRRPLVKCRSVM